MAKTAKMMRNLGPKHVKAPTPKLTQTMKISPIASVEVQVAAVPIPSPTLVVGATVAYDHPSCLGQGKSGVILAEPTSDGKVLVKFGGGTRRVLARKLVAFPAAS